MNHHALSGIITPLVTPLNAELNLDKHGLANIIEHVIACGVNGIFLLGSTGEGPALRDEIRKEVIREGVRAVSGRIPVYMNISTASYMESRALAEFAAREGADCVVLSPPFYFEMNPHELMNYFISLAKLSPLPLLVYNAPKYTKIALPPELVRKLAGHKNIIGIKDSSEDLDYIQELIHAREEQHFPILIGSEMLLGESLLLGCEGGVSGGANLYPSVFVKFYHAAIEKNMDDMEFYQKLIRLIQTNLYAVPRSPQGIVIGLKYLLAHRGLCSNQMAMPVFETLTGEQKHILESLDKQIRQI